MRTETKKPAFAGFLLTPNQDHMWERSVSLLGREA